MRSCLVYHMQDIRTPQEQMSNIRAVYGNRNAKSVTYKRIVVRNLQKIGSRPLSLHDDAEISDSLEELIFHLLQVSGP
jgi:hypothetical protein